MVDQGEGFATSPPEDEQYLTFQVAPEVVEHGLGEWSEAVRLRFTKHDDGTTTLWIRTMEDVATGAGVLAVAELLRSQYLSEYETSAPVEDWIPQAEELIAAYLKAAGP